jgi:hypothetical protein
MVLKVTPHQHFVFSSLLQHMTLTKGAVIILKRSILQTIFDSNCKCQYVLALMDDRVDGFTTQRLMKLLDILPNYISIE